MINTDLRDQNLRFGHDSRPNIQSSHGRQWSDASDLSQQSGSSRFLELDGSRVKEPEAAAMGAANKGARGRSFTFMTHRRKRSTESSGSQLLTPALLGQSQRLENVVEIDIDSVNTGAMPKRSDISRASVSHGGRLQYPNQVERNTLPLACTAKDSTKEATKEYPREIADIIFADSGHEPLSGATPDLEQVVGRLEGQKTIGTGMDMLHSRKR